MKDEHKSFIDVTKSPTDSVEYVFNHGIRPQTVAGNHGTRLLKVSACSAVTLIQTYVEKRGSSNGPLAEQHAGVAPPANRTSCENILVARVLVLPVVPHLIDHLHDRLVSHCPNATCDRTNRMVKEKHRICVKNGIFQSVNVLRQLGSFPPFGDHFGPG